MTATTDDLRTHLAGALAAVLIHAPVESDEDDIAAALLPAVESYGRACAATALRDAADAYDAPGIGAVLASGLRSRADAAEAGR